MAGDPTGNPHIQYMPESCWLMLGEQSTEQSSSPFLMGAHEICAHLNLHFLCRISLILGVHRVRAPQKNSNCTSCRVGLSMITIILPSKSDHFYGRTSSSKIGVHHCHDAAPDCTWIKLFRNSWRSDSTAGYRSNSSLIHGRIGDGPEDSTIRGSNNQVIFSTWKC